MARKWHMDDFSDIINVIAEIITSDSMIAPDNPSEAGCQIRMRFHADREEIKRRARDAVTLALGNAVKELATGVPSPRRVPI